MVTGVFENYYVSLVRFFEFRETRPRYIETEFCVWDSDPIRCPHTVNKLVTNEKITRHDGVFHGTSRNDVCLNNGCPQGKCDNENNQKRFYLL
jgi:hypothetical protein